MTTHFTKKNKAPKSAAKVKGAKKAKEVKVIVESAKPVNVKFGGLDLTMVLVRPHVTEKATDLSEKGVYAFEIHEHANKMLVRQAVEKLFKVQPVKIAMINTPAKYMKNPRTGRVQVKKTATRKALVFLKKGDKLEIV